METECSLIHGRVHTGEIERVYERDHLLAAHHLARVAGHDHGRNDVIGEVVSVPLDHFAQLGGQAPRRIEDLGLYAQV